MDDNIKIITIGNLVTYVKLLGGIKKGPGEPVYGSDVDWNNMSPIWRESWFRSNFPFPEKPIPKNQIDITFWRE